MVQLSIKTLVALSVFAATTSQAYVQYDGCAADTSPRATCDSYVDCCGTEFCDNGTCAPKEYYGCSSKQNAGNICDANDECCGNEQCNFYMDESETGVCELKKAWTGCKEGQHSGNICDGNDDCCDGEQCNFYMEVSETGTCESKNVTMTTQ